MSSATAGSEEILGSTARLVLLAFESQGRWRNSATDELLRLARLKESLLQGERDTLGSSSQLTALSRDLTFPSLTVSN